jgi:toxin FitB
MFLVDTNVLSHTAPTETKPHSALVDWLRRNGDHLYLSVVTIMEIRAGVAWQRHRRVMKKAKLLDAWLTAVVAFHADKIIAVGSEIALRAGELLARGRAAGIETGADDALIGATAEVHRLTVMTANERHFAPLRVPFVNPFRELPPDIPPVTGER